ncbi:hypothetical protein P5G50_09685 [Leifsonia sp. F6_8S_P_1B]|uniref:EfeO-type cupredoxin-like domain-containing protein n=1 Tax=Leifsonia williamsii TaxID=3035919 RepID=A0ABT8KB86_9MICO|nr:hypothetical protein [Leifsonia williamsii]MDN4614724.1 hypothetical protein [Leifsonia williamsii]
MRIVPLLVIGAVTAGLLGGCAAPSAPSGGSSATGVPTASPSNPPHSHGASAPQLDISLVGGAVYPQGERLTVARGQELTVGILADNPGELHVHSKPEQHIAFEAGSTIHVVTFSVPGVVEIEDHASDTVIAQVEVK